MSSAAAAAVAAFMSVQRREYDEKESQNRATIQYNYENFLWELQQSGVEYDHERGEIIRFWTDKLTVAFTKAAIGCDPEGARATLKEYGIVVPKVIP